MSNLPDITDLELQSEIIETDESVTPEQYFAERVVEDGDHLVVMHPGKNRDGEFSTNGRQTDKETGEKTGKMFCTFFLQFNTLNDDGSEGMAVFDQVTTIVVPDIRTSKVDLILKCVKQPAKSGISLAELKSQFTNSVAAGLKLKIGTQWQASAKIETEEQAELVSTGKKKYKVGDYYTFLRGMKKFPPKTDSEGKIVGYEPEATDPKTGLVGKRRVTVVRYLPA